MEMPALPIVPLEKFVVGSNTGPCGGLCQLHPELDHPTHERGTGEVVSLYNFYLMLLASCCYRYVVHAPCCYSYIVHTSYFYGCSMHSAHSKHKVLTT